MEYWLLMFFVTFPVYGLFLFVTPKLAEEKGRKAHPWFWLAVFTGPIAFLVLAAFPNPPRS